MASEASLSAREEGCDWVRCQAPFVGAYNDVEVIPEGGTMRVKVGRVALCSEHFRIFKRERRLQLDWERIVKGEPCVG
jgi:hypothetical protein